MRNYYIKRLISSLITLLIVASLTFFLMKAIPGGPFDREKQIAPQILEQLNEKYNLNAPLYVQYFDYMKGVVTYNFGYSFSKTGVKVNFLIEEGFPTSAKIGLWATLLIVALGVPVGVISALKQNKPIDYFVMFMATLGVTIPSFVIATMIIYYFAGVLGWIDPYGLKSWKGYIGPVLALSGYSLSFVARLTRSSMLEVLRQDYVRTARANGLSELMVIGKYALKNAIIPVITYVGPMIAAILTGSFVIEKIFGLPGMGGYFVESVTSRDYTVIMGMTVFYSAFYIIMVLLVDLIYPLIDPRIKLND